MLLSKRSLNMLACVATTMLAACDVEDAAIRAPRMTLVTIGDAHSCALAESGEAYCWGDGLSGQLGTGAAGSSRFARRVSGNQTFAFIDAGGRHTCALTDAGEAFCWGANESGQLGRGNQQSAHAPARVNTTRRFIWISAGGAHTCGVTADNRALCWGNGTSGELGNGEFVGPVLTPDSVATTLRFGQISAGLTHTCAITVNSEAYCWGANELAQLGIATRGLDVPVPTRAAGNLLFRNISAGWTHTCGATLDFGGYCWGTNGSGELGNGAQYEAEALPAQVMTYGSILYTQVSAGKYYSCGVWTIGQIYCWGRGDYGQIGNATLGTFIVPQMVRPEPGRVLDHSSGVFASFDAGGDNHVCGLSFTGTVFCWGGGAQGQLGSGEWLSAVPYPLLMAQP